MDKCCNCHTWQEHEEMLDFNYDSSEIVKGFCHVCEHPIWRTREEMGVVDEMD